MTSIVSQPRVTVNIVNAAEAVQNTTQKVLFVGQKVAAGSTASGSLVQNIASDNSEDSLFGINSMLAAMVRAAKKENPITIMDAIPLDDSVSGIDAEGTLTIVGTSTAAGSLTVVIGSEINHTLTVAVALGDTPTVIAASIVSAITADTKIPVTAANVAGVVTVTAVNAGTLGNQLGISIVGIVAGVTHSITAMTGGLADPTLTSVFDVIADNRYQTIIWPYATDTTVVRALLDARFNVVNKVQDGIAITSYHDSLANHNGRLLALNSQSLTFFVDQTESETSYKAPAQFERSEVKSAQFGAIRSLRLTDGASISRYVITANGPLDSFGGPALASKPYFNTSTPSLPLIRVGHGWTDTEIEQLFDNGGSVLGQNTAGNGAIAGEVVTTYKTDPAGNPDISFKFMNYVDTASGAREYFFNNLKSRFAQSRLTAGSVQPGRDQANDLTIINFCEKLYQDLSGVDFVLLQDGEEAIQFFKNNLSVTLDLANGKATVLMTVPIVTQLRETAATLKIAFNTG